ncbi:unnamed protein product [Lathyrus sativus]|nr:unnamed protein product [Lathyrus sativus]
MKSVISEMQLAFIPGRQILDGILITNEIVDEAKQKKKKVILFRANFEKAYDSVDFRMFEVVKSVDIGNVSPTKEFSVDRGLKKGDPHSPLLFLLVAEGFNLLMKRAPELGSYTGYKIDSDKEIYTL